MHVDPEGWLESGTHPIERWPSNRVCAMAVASATGVVWHWTGTRGDTDRHAVNVAKSIQRHATAKSVGSSWHLLIARSGLIVQSVPLHLGAIHCRGSLGGHEVNRAMFGIELENAGYCLQRNGEWFGVDNPHESQERWRPGPWRVPADEVKTHGVPLHAYTDAQERTAEAVLRALAAYAPGLNAESCGWGHCDLDGERKADPGPEWLRVRLPRVLGRVFGAAACGGEP